MEKIEVTSPLAPRSIGPYSPAISSRGILFISGQIAIEPETGEMKRGIEEETHQALRNLMGLLKEAGLSERNVVKTTIFLKNIEDFPTVNDIYSKYFSPPYPARSTIQVAGLPKGALLEIEAIAIRD